MAEINLRNEAAENCRLQDAQLTTTKLNDILRQISIRTKRKRGHMGVSRVFFFFLDKSRSAIDTQKGIYRYIIDTILWDWILTHRRTSLRPILNGLEPYSYKRSDLVFT